jgi:hypothetical protein
LIKRDTGKGHVASQSGIAQQSQESQQTKLAQCKQPQEGLSAFPQECEKQPVPKHQ